MPNREYGYRCTTCKKIYDSLPPLGWTCIKCGSPYFTRDEVKRDETSEESPGCGSMIMGLLTLAGIILLLMIAFGLVITYC